LFGATDTKNAGIVVSKVNRIQTRSFRVNANTKNSYVCERYCPAHQEKKNADYCRNNLENGTLRFVGRLMGARRLFQADAGLL